MNSWVLGPLSLVIGCGSAGSQAKDPVDAASDASPVFDASAGAAASSSAACNDAGVPPSLLECTGLYANFATKEIAPNALAYTPSAPLWSDGAQKQRWVLLPEKEAIDISNPNEWTFPVGTKFFKEFRVNGQRVETRMFQKTKADFWVYATTPGTAKTRRRRSTSAAPSPSAMTVARGTFRRTTTATSAIADVRIVSSASTRSASGSPARKASRSRSSRREGS